MFLHLLVFLLSSEELGLREGFSKSLLGHERLQLQQCRHSAVQANETGAIGIKVDCGKPNQKKKYILIAVPKNTETCRFENSWLNTDPIRRSEGAGLGSQSVGSRGYSDQGPCTPHLMVAEGEERKLSPQIPILPDCRYGSHVPRQEDREPQFCLKTVREC